MLVTGVGLWVVCLFAVVVGWGWLVWVELGCVIAGASGGVGALLAGCCLGVGRLGMGAGRLFSLVGRFSAAGCRGWGSWPVEMFVAGCGLGCRLAFMVCSAFSGWLPLPCHVSLCLVFCTRILWVFMRSGASVVCFCGRGGSCWRVAARCR